MSRPQLQEDIGSHMSSLALQEDISPRLIQILTTLT